MLEGLKGKEACVTDPDFQRLVSVPLDAFLVDNKLRKHLRKYLKSQGLAVSNAGVDLYDELRSIDTVASAVVQDQPFVELSDEADLSVAIGPYRLPSLDPNSFYLNVPIAEVPNTFMMEAGHSSNPGQWSETLFEILGYATYQGRDVTKLRLVPQTGRRHQLRIHCLYLGHPIVGDATYCPPELESACESADRMMLHSHKLRVPLLGNSTSSEGLLTPDLTAVEFEAPDPFNINAQGQLVVRLPSYTVK
jgi:hypothetical protein